MNNKHQFAWFCAVGTAGFIVDACALYAFAGLLGWYGARVLSFWMAATTTWVLNRHFTFKASARQVLGRSGRSGLAHEYAQYLVSMLAGGCVNYGLYALALVFIKTPWAPIVGLAAGSIGGLVVNYASARFWVFRKR